MNPSVISRNAAPRVTDRDGRLSAQLDHVAIRRWHATITAKPPDTGLGVGMIPPLTSAVFRSRKAAQDAGCRRAWCRLSRRLSIEVGRPRLAGPWIPARLVSPGDQARGATFGLAFTPGKGRTSRRVST